MRNTKLYGLVTLMKIIHGCQSRTLKDMLWISYNNIKTQIKQTKTIINNKQVVIILHQLDLFVMEIKLKKYLAFKKENNLLFNGRRRMENNYQQVLLVETNF